MSASKIEIELVAADGTSETSRIEIAPDAVVAHGGAQVRRVSEGLALASEDGREVLLPWHGEVVFEDKLWRVGAAPAATGSGASARPVLLAALAIAASAVLLLGPAGSAAGPRPAPEPPELFPQLAPCEPDRAASAPALETRGLALRDRYPFAPEVGIEAVEHLETAASCHSASGNLARSETSARAATRLRAQVEEDFRARRFRLGRALESGRTEDALRQVRALSALLRDRDGDYADWLREMDRALSRRAGGAS